MVNEIAESYPLARSRLPQNLEFEESRPKAVGGLFSLPMFYFLLDMIVAIRIPKEIMSVSASKILILPPPLIKRGRAFYTISYLANLYYIKISIIFN